MILFLPACIASAVIGTKFFAGAAVVTFTEGFADAVGVGFAVGEEVGAGVAEGVAVGVAVGVGEGVGVLLTV